MKKLGFLPNLVALLFLLGAFLVGLWQAKPPEDIEQANTTANIGQANPLVDNLTASANSTTVIIDGFAYYPPVLTVPRGTTVTWINKYPVAHRVASNGSSPNFTSASLSTGGWFGWTFTEPGSYPYYCANHPTMKGTIVVK